MEVNTRNGNEKIGTDNLLCQDLFFGGTNNINETGTILVALTSTLHFDYF